MCVLHTAKGKFLCFVCKYISIRTKPLFHTPMGSIHEKNWDEKSHATFPSIRIILYTVQYLKSVTPNFFKIILFLPADCLVCQPLDPERLLVV